MSQRAIIRNQNRKWKTLWIAATLILLVSLLLNTNLYFVYLFVYIAAIIIFFYGRLRYAEIDRAGIRLYLGLFLKQSYIEIDWAAIDGFDFISVPRKYKNPVTRIMERFGFTANVRTDEYAKIRLKKPLPASDQKMVNEAHLGILGEKVLMRSNGRSMYLQESPDIGFRQLCELAQAYLYKENHYINFDDIAWDPKSLVINMILIILPFLLILLL